MNAVSDSITKFFYHMIGTALDSLISFQERLLSVVLGLIRQKRFRFLHLYKDEVYSIIKSCIKEVYFIKFQVHTKMSLGTKHWYKQLSCIERLQNRAIRIITNSAYDVSARLLPRQLILPSISDVIKQESASMVC